jgi:hypothetical protein
MTTSEKESRIGIEQNIQTDNNEEYDANDEQMKKLHLYVL